MVFYYFSLLLFSFLLISSSSDCHLCIFLTSLWTWCNSDCVWCGLIGSQFVFRGRRGLLAIAGHLEAWFLMFLRHTASKFTGTVKLRFLIGLPSLLKDSSTGVESIYWLKCVLLRYDGWPHAPFILLEVDLSPVDLLRHRCSHSQHVVSLGKLVTRRQPNRRLQLLWIYPKNVIGWTLSRHSKQANRLFHHHWSQLVTVWSFLLLASCASHNETHPQRLVQSYCDWLKWIRSGMGLYEILMVW